MYTKACVGIHGGGNGREKGDEVSSGRTQKRGHGDERNGAVGIREVCAG